MGKNSAVIPDALWQVGAMLRLLRAVDQQLRAATPPALSLSELSVLSQVRQGRTLPSQIARALGADPARVTHLVSRLVAAGALTRTLDPSDRRCWRLGVTGHGEMLLDAGRDSMQAALKSLLACLTDEERTAMSVGLAGVRRVLAPEALAR
ncbi:MAG TPA: MarR family transcriptional regulator [Chloroflexota bacterium]|nr:MarR family transcriptional regulator [Chloroflexota bacterium]